MRLVPAIACLVALLALAMPSTTVAQTGCPGDTTPDFTDNCYHEYIIYNVDQAEIDILILPSVDQYTLRDAEILKASVESWEAGINDLGPAWLASGMNLHPYRVGLDDTPEEALFDPEIIIVTGEVNPYVLAGIGQQGAVNSCHGQPWPLMVETVAEMPGLHKHPNSPLGSLSIECENGGRHCFVINTNFYTTSATLANMRDLFDLNSHELGHCLGIGHVGDATFDFQANVYPKDDIMSYESDGWEPNYVLCVSTLNIKALEQVYGHLLGQTGYPVWAAGTYVHQSPSAWSDDNCTDPVNHSWTDASPVTESEMLGGLGLETVDCAVNAFLFGLLLNWAAPVLACLL